MGFREEGSDTVVTVPLVALERTARSRALLILGELSLVDPGLRDEKSRVLAIYPPPESVEEMSLGELKDLAAEVAKQR